MVRRQISDVTGFFLSEIIAQPGFRTFAPNKADGALLAIVELEHKEI